MNSSVFELRIRDTNRDDCALNILYDNFFFIEECNGTRSLILAILRARIKTSII